MSTSASYRFAPCNVQLVDDLRAALGCSETLAWILARRGIDVATARSMFDDAAEGHTATLHDPMLLGDMAAAVERIQYAIEQHEPIVVHGDYDADGICATTLLVEGLEELGADVRAFLPDRFRNGYGLQLDQVERFARDGIRLLVTVDCGITAVEPVAQAGDLGMDVVICDHHRPADTLPNAIIASTRPSDYPFPDICATVVAGKLLVALGGPSGPRQHELEAIATVADCMPLVDENRAIVLRGLRALRTTQRPGLVALIDSAGLRPRDVDADAIGFKLAPRLNAAGRIAHPDRGYELLRAADAADATHLAGALDEINNDRRGITARIVADAIERIESWSPARRDASIYVVHGPGWHEGVVGIVASNLAERYWRPVVVLADGDPMRGSARSVDGVDLHAALASCDDLLLRWGGHAQAAGLTVDPTRVDELQARLAAWGQAKITPEQLAPSDWIDAIVPGSELRMDLVNELERLAPFGEAWNRPRLLAMDARLVDASAVGGDGTHLRCRIDVDGTTVPAIGFGLAVASLPLATTGAPVDVALQPTINRFRGVESMQASLDRIYPVDVAARWQLAGGWAMPPAADHGRTLPALDQLVEHAAGLVPSPLDGADATVVPALEPLLARSTTLDLRHRGIGAGHVAQLLAAGATVLVVVADAARRAEAFAAVLGPERLAATAAVIADERIEATELRRRIAELEAVPGARLVLTDHTTLPAVLDAGTVFDVVVVHDPPMLDSHRDALSRVDPPLHLTFGAREQRFAGEALAAMLDVRGTLGATWKHLRDAGPTPPAQLADLIVGSAPFGPTPSAVVHALRTLFERELLRVDADGRLEAIDPSRSATTTPA